MPTEAELARHDELEAKRRKMDGLTQTHRCSDCGGILRVAWKGSAEEPVGEWYLRCGQGHVNTTAPWKTAPRNTKEETYAEKRRREIEMDNRFGPERSTVLARHAETKELAKVDAWEVMRTVYPDIPDADLARAVGICIAFKLNPLMNHLYMVKFRKNIGTKDKPNWVDTWQPILAADATRLMASRSGPISYGVDDTPRILTKEDQLSRMGQSWDDRLWVIYKVQDPKSGAVATGFGFWLNKDEVRGADLGNSAFNMASKRAEIQAVKKLRPSELPENIRTMDTEELKAALDSEEGVVEGEFAEVPADPALPSGEQEAEEKQGPGASTEDKPPAIEAEVEAVDDMDIPEGKKTKPVTKQEQEDLATMLKECGKTDEDLGKFCNGKPQLWHITSIKDLSRDRYETVKAALGENLL